MATCSQSPCTAPAPQRLPLVSPGPQKDGENLTGCDSTGHFLHFSFPVTGCSQRTSGHSALPISSDLAVSYCPEQSYTSIIAKSLPFLGSLMPQGPLGSNKRCAHRRQSPHSLLVNLFKNHAKLFPRAEIPSLWSIICHLHAFLASSFSSTNINKASTVTRAATLGQFPPPQRHLVVTGFSGGRVSAARALPLDHNR